MTLSLVQQNVAAWDLNQHFATVTLANTPIYASGDLMVMVVMGSIHRGPAGSTAITVPSGWTAHGTYYFVGRNGAPPFPPGDTPVTVSVISPVWSKPWTGETSVALSLPDDWWYPSGNTGYARIEVWRGAVGDVQGVGQTTNNLAIDPGITGSGRIFVAGVNTKFDTTGINTLGATGFTGGSANVATDPGAPGLGWAFATKHLDAAGAVDMPGVQPRSPGANPNTLSWFIRDTPDVAPGGLTHGITWATAGLH